jgi:two-component system response regulator NreC
VPSEARDADESSASARGRVVTPQRGAGARVAGRRFVLHDGLYFCTTRQTFLDVGSTVIRILIVDGHLVVRDALATVLGAVRGLLIVGKAASIRQTVPLLEHTVPDLLLADLCLQDGSGIELARMLRRSCSKTRALIMAGFRDEFYAAEALAAGVSGYVLKAQPTSDLLAAIETVSRGETYVSPTIAASLRPTLRLDSDDNPLGRLSRRECEIFRRVVVGASTKEISASLFISVKTVDTHRTNINRKLGVRSTAGLIRFAVAHGISIAPSGTREGADDAVALAVDREGHQPGAREGLPRGGGLADPAAQAQKV